MRIEYLRYFDHLAKTPDLAQAAKELYIAQPTLSLAIKRMEDELGFALIVRGAEGSHSTLTPMGKALQKHVSNMLASYDAGLKEAYEVRDEVDATLRVGTIYAMQGPYWSQAIAAFMDSRSIRPRLLIEQAFSSELKVRLRMGELDVIFAPSDTDAGFNRVQVWSQPLVLCVNKDNPLAAEERVSLATLKEHELLTYAPTSPIDSILKKQLPMDELNLQRVCGDEFDLCAEVAQDPSKMGLVCYSFLIKDSPEVRFVRLDDFPVDFLKIYLMTRREAHSKTVQSFIDFMSSYHFPNILETA